MSPLFAQVIDAFSQAGWECRRVEGREVVEADFEAHHAKVSLHVQAFPEVGGIAVVSECGIRVSEAQRAAAAELLMRTNKELTLGNFEMDWDSGTVFFRISNVFGDGGVDASILASLVRTNVVETDRITPFLGELVSAGKKGEWIDVAHLMSREDLLPQLGHENV